MAATGSTGPFYPVERILASRQNHGRKEFLIRWEGYGPSDDTWEPDINLMGTAQSKVKEFERNRHTLEVNGGSPKKRRPRASDVASSPGRSSTRPKSPARRRTDTSPARRRSLRTQRKLIDDEDDDTADQIDPWTDNIDDRPSRPLVNEEDEADGPEVFAGFLNLQQQQQAQQQVHVAITAKREENPQTLESVRLRRDTRADVSTPNGDAHSWKQILSPESQASDQSSLRFKESNDFVDSPLETENSAEDQQLSVESKGEMGRVVVLLLVMPLCWLAFGVWIYLSRES